MRRITGAILRVTVPATILRSDCRGEARNTPAPKRSMSYREDTLAIILIAQQASPKVIGQSADFLDQFTTASRVVVITFASNCRSNTLIIYSLASKGTPAAPGMGSTARVRRAHSHRARRTSTEPIPGAAGFSPIRAPP